MRRIAVCIVVGAFVLGGCGTKPKDSAAGSGAATPTLSPTVPSSTTPPKTLANKPGCAEMSRWSIAQLGVAYAPPDKRAEASAALDQTATALKAAVPQFSADIDTTVAISKRAAEGKSQPGDTEASQKAGEAIGKWFNETCA
ncbi:MAG: hypothetical protein U0Q07_19395 [Acidimicrobiales bacterium]